MQKYETKEAAIQEADRQAQNGTPMCVIYCYKSQGYYVDEAGTMVRNFEERVYSTDND